MAAPRSSRLAALAAVALLLAACEDGSNPFATLMSGSGNGTAPEALAETPPADVETVERDVEAPDVFEATEKGLWDGRPSLGGVWVAYPDVATPERVVVRNTVNGQEVVGALFRREREMPGPRIQVSSEAAAELGMLAGQPADLYVVALKRERVPVAPAPSEAIAGGEIESAPLESAATAAAALEAVGASSDTRPAPRPAAATAAPAPAATSAPAPAPQPSAAPAASAPALSGGSFIQIGIFSVEQNAQNAAESLRVSGIVPNVREQTSGDNTYWRVLVGPVTSAADRSALLEKVRDLGYADAYVISN